MDLAQSTHIDPPPLLFGRRPDSPMSSPHHNPDPTSSEPPSSEMDLSASGVLPPQQPETSNNDADQPMPDSDPPDRPTEDAMDTTPDSAPPPPITSSDAPRSSEEPESQPESSVEAPILVPGTVIIAEEAMDTTGGVEIPVAAAPVQPAQTSTTDLPPPSVAQLDPPPPRGTLDTMSDSSSDDEDDGRDRMDFEEDKSGPSEDELKDIELRGGEKSANDHDYFTRRFFKPLDDPEYIPADIGRIEWVVKGVRGTYNERSNHKLLRSPRVRIGDLDWNIKYFPKGNGTSQISIYLECSKPDSSPKRKKSRTEASQSQTTKASNSEPKAPGPERQSSSEESHPASPGAVSQAPVAEIRIRDDASEATEDADDEDSSDMSESDTPSPKRRKALDHSWGMAAQFGVVMYNPEEPRTNVYHGNHHLFCASAPDWGWTRFHGPSETIHKRRAGQRTALLRNDTIAFTAYIRTVKDHTKSLWDHSAKDGSEWNSLAKTGLRALGGEGLGRAYVVAGLSAWLLLRPVRELICKAKVPHPDRCEDSQQMPLIFELQCLLHRLQTQGNKPHSSVQLDQFARIFAYRYDLTLTDKLDVIEFWETLRMKMEHELEGSGLEHKLADMFDSQVVMAAEHVQARCLPGGHRPAEGSVVTIPGIRFSPQEFSGTANYFKTITSQNSANMTFKSLPKVLNLEIERFVFDSSERRWKRKDSHIQLDEEIEVGPHTLDSSADAKYVLYGFVTHEGDLRSGHFNSILRPGGPGSKWFRYMSERQGSKVEALTQKKASALNGSKSQGSVAYIAIYVRNDVKDEFLVGLPESPSPPEWLQEYCDVYDKEFLALGDLPPLPTDLTARASPRNTATATATKSEPTQEISLTVVDAEIFKDLKGAGTFAFDFYGTNFAEDPKPHVQIVTSTADKTFKDLQEQIAGADEWKRCQLWSMLEGRPSQAINPNQSLALFDKAKLWLRKLTPEEAEKWIDQTKMEPLLPKPPVTAAIPPPPPPTAAAGSSSVPPPPPPPAIATTTSTTTTTTGLEGETGESGARISMPFDFIHTPTPQTATDSEAMQIEDPEADEAARTIAQMISAAPPSDGAISPAPASPPSLAGQAAVINLIPLPQPPPQLIQSGSSSTDMLTIDPPLPSGISLLPPPPAPTSTLSLPEPIHMSNAFLPVPLREIYVLVKHFDPETQTLTGLGTMSCKREANIAPSLRERFEIDKELEVTVWEENWIGRARKLNASQNFEYEGISSGAVVIWQPKLAPEDERRLESSALCPTVSDYLQNVITARNYPSLQNGQYTFSYFGGSYFSGTLVHGRQHGQGTSISAAGDVYQGPFVYGRQHGSSGAMVFASGDRYVGGWVDGCMDGQGKMSYAKTGNVYEGGFKADRRHGKGTMHFLVADDEANTCQICYEAEMDAVFNDCGHLCACMGCARQVELCPVCRKTVLSVIKLFKS